MVCYGINQQVDHIEFIHMSKLCGFCDNYKRLASDDTNR